MNILDEKGPFVRSAIIGSWSLYGIMLVYSFAATHMGTADNAPVTPATDGQAAQKAPYTSLAAPKLTP